MGCYQVFGKVTKFKERRKCARCRKMFIKIKGSIYCEECKIKNSGDKP